MHPYQEKEPLEPFPDNVNPKTGELGGPRGPEPTRYGDWERKGRVTDFWIMWYCTYCCTVNNSFVHIVNFINKIIECYIFLWK